MNQGCARFVAILLVRARCQFFYNRCSFISHRPFIAESCNCCHVDEQFVPVQVENINISAKRAYQ